MSDTFITGVGAVLSADIAVPDHEREVHFYSRVLRTGPSPLWREDMMSNVGVPIIGLGELSEQYAALPRQWMPHIQVADVGASVARALELGGTELMHARGDDGTSQWAVLLDPQGAAFGLVPLIPAEAIPPPSQDMPQSIGRIAWLDLTVEDVGALRNFYEEVVGWQPRRVEREDGEARYVGYHLLGEDEVPLAAIHEASGERAGLPPVWVIYLPVGDLEESLRRAEDEGGRVIRLIDAEDGEGARAVLRDPVGAYFGVTGPRA